MSQQNINKAFISAYDKFLYQFDELHEPSLSQLKEIKKHERIAYLRDNPASQKEDDIWEKF